MHLVRQNQTLDADQILKLAGITIEPTNEHRYAVLKQKAEAAYAEFGGMGNVNMRLIRSLVEECDKYRAIIKRMGEINDHCTFDDLGKICDGCHCARMPKG